MKAILIDVKAETVTEIASPLKLKDIYALLGCELIQSAGMVNRTDTLYVDEEGLLTLTNKSKFFKIVDSGFPPLAGNGLIVGVNHRNGNTISCTSTIDEIRSKVKFFTLAQIRQILNK